MIEQESKIPYSTTMIRQNDVKVPKGVEPAKNGYYPGVNSISFARKAIRGHPTSGKAFEVTPLHTMLKGDIEGVVFAVEDTVADKKDKAMPTISRREEIKAIREDSAQFYDQPEFEMKVEQASQTPSNLVYSGGHGFLAAVLTAFARHLPLTLGPDEVWVLISFAFAKHVDKHAEELRHHFVAHEGKKRLLVEVNFGPTGDPGTGSSPEVWEELVFPDFSSQIRGYIGAETHDTIAGRFSTTTKVAQAAHEVTLMSAMKNYFSYGMSTMCGISKVTLLGSEADWKELRVRAEALGSKMTKKFSDMWLPKLLPILDQFVAAYQGDVHHGFWQSMVKMRHKSAFGSGESSEDYITGWVQILYPYLKSGSLNRNMQSWENCYWNGPETGDFPSILSSAPVDWDKLEMHFHAGITGFTQDPVDGALRPAVGWRVTHDPEKDPHTRIANYKEEIEALQKGMTNDDADYLGQSRIYELEYLVHNLEWDIERDQKRKISATIK